MAEGERRVERAGGTERTVERVPAHIDDPFAARAVRVAYHLKRHLPYYALGMVWVLMITVFPSLRPGDGSSVGQATGVFAGGSSERGAEVEFVDDDGPDNDGGPEAVASPTGSVSGGARRAGTASPATTGTAALSPQLESLAGKTRAGVECKAGVRQLPWSEYAAPCVAAFTGDNGGETFRGVTEDTITIVRRHYPSNQSQETLVSSVCARGGCPEQSEDEQEETERRRVQGLEWFNTMYELYGRKVVFLDMEAHPAADQFAELRGGGQEAACADATRIVEELKAFAVSNGSGVGAGTFDECAAQRKLLSVYGGQYAPEDTHYRKLHPYVWQVVWDCSRLILIASEYIGKRLAGKTAKFARDPLYRQTTRTWGRIRSSIRFFDSCNKLFESEVKSKWGVELVSDYTYTFDPSRYADDAARAVIQFKAAGVTSLSLHADMLFLIFLTQQASQQDWGPEWVSVGSGNQDVDFFARLWDQPAIDGHYFGMSQLGSEDKMQGPDAEARKAWRTMSGDAEDLETAMPSYWEYLWVFNMLQMAGPNLTPENVARGMFAYPGGGMTRAERGRWAFDTNADGTPGFDHTAIDDAREIYWDGRAAASGGNRGKFIETYGGRRFGVGEWPREDPPIYPDRS